MSDTKTTLLYRLVDHIILTVWDPIGIAKDPQCRDEYKDYLPKICTVVIDAKSPDDIAEHLCSVRLESLGVTDLSLTRKDREAADLLWECYTSLDNAPYMTMRAHQYLYYCKFTPVLSDYEYDKFCRDNELEGKGGSDLESSYTTAEKALAALLVDPRTAGR